MCSKLTGADFPQQCTIYSTDCYSHVLEPKARNAFTSLPQRKASFGRFESATSSPLTSTSHLECIINSWVGTCCFLTLFHFLAEPDQAGFTFWFLPCFRRQGSCWQVGVVSLFNTLTALHRNQYKAELVPFLLELPCLLSASQPHYRLYAPNPYGCGEHQCGFSEFQQVYLPGWRHPRVCATVAHLTPKVCLSQPFQNQVLSSVIKKKENPMCRWQYGVILPVMQWAKLLSYHCSERNRKYFFSKS